MAISAHSKTRYIRLAAVLLAVLGFSPTPVVAQYDSFELPPGAEYTPIPKRMRYSMADPRTKQEQKLDEGIAYALKEFKLGMSLDDFTKVGAPAGADPAKVKAVCSCEASQDVESVNDEDRTAKVVQCGFWNKEGDKLAGGPYRMTVGGLQCSPDFRFIEDGGIYRLYEISVALYSSNFKDMQAALINKYGQPTSQKVVKMRTESGNIYPATNLIWDNGVSRIRLSNVDGTNIGRARLRYLHQRLFIAYAGRINDQRATPMKRASDDL